MDTPDDLGFGAAGTRTDTIGRPRRFLNQELSQTPTKFTPIERGFFSTVIETSKGLLLHDTLARWRMLDDTTPAITPWDFKERVGDREIKYEPYMTEADAERRIALYDWEQEQAEYEQRGVAQFIGAIAPVFLYPSSVATLPLGASNFAKAASGSFRQMVVQSAIGGAKVGVASAPLDIAEQHKLKGTVDAEAAMMALVAPVIASPVLGALGRAARAGYRKAFGKVADADLARGAESSPHVKPDAHPDDVARALERRPDVPVPRETESRAAPYTPTQRMEELFHDYRGSVTGWLNDMADGKVEAHAVLERLGIDPKDSAIIDELSGGLRMIRRAVDNIDTAPEVNIRVMNAVKEFAETGKLTSEADKDLLYSMGMFDAKARMEGSEPTLTKTGEFLAKAQKPESGQAGKDVSAQYADKGNIALRKPMAEAGETEIPPVMADLGKHISMAEVMRSLEAARAEAGVPMPELPPVRNIDQKVPSKAVLDAENEIAELTQQLTKHGSDAADVESAMGKMKQAIKECAIG